MVKKIVVVDGKIANALVGLLANPPKITLVDEASDVRAIELDYDTHTICYDPKMIQALENSMSEQELWGIRMHDALALVNERKLGDYKLPEAKLDVAEPFEEKLPANAKAPDFILKQNHRITKVRR